MTAKELLNVQITESVAFAKSVISQAVLNQYCQGFFLSQQLAITSIWLQNLHNYEQIPIANEQQRN